MSAILPPMPLQAPLLEVGANQKPTDFLSGDWYKWFFQEQNRIQAGVQSVGGPPSFRTAQAASIGATGIPLTAVNVPSVQAGFYRVNWYARVTQAASVGSSLSLTLTWTEHGITLTTTTSAVTGNTTTTTLVGSQVLYSDAPGPVSYSTTYASSGATPMQYLIAVWAELIA